MPPSASEKIVSRPSIKEDAAASDAPPQEATAATATVAASDDDVGFASAAMEAESSTLVEAGPAVHVLFNSIAAVENASTQEGGSALVAQGVVDTVRT